METEKRDEKNEEFEILIRTLFHNDQILNAHHLQHPPRRDRSMNYQRQQPAIECSLKTTHEVRVHGLPLTVDYICVAHEKHNTMATV